MNNIKIIREALSSYLDLSRHLLSTSSPCYRYDIEKASEALAALDEMESARPINNIGAKDE